MESSLSSGSNGMRKVCHSFLKIKPPIQLRQFYNAACVMFLTPEINFIKLREQLFVRERCRPMALEPLQHDPGRILFEKKHQ